MRTRNILTALIAIGAAGGLLAPRAAAQAITTGTIEATVADTQGGVLPGAAVTLRDVTRGTSATQAADAAGRVQFLVVPVGTYELRAELQGFAAAAFSNVRINPASHQRFTFQLQLGTVQETITVAADAPLINTKSAQESTTVDDKYLEGLPLITRNYTEMATIFPGVAYSRGARTAYNQFNVRGGATTGNAYQLDGGSLNRGVGRAGILVAPSFIERLEFVPGGFPAEYSGYQSSVINLVSKSGTNRPQGYFSAIYKPNAFISTIDSGLRDQVRDKPLGSTRFFEGSVGGPILRDRLWYFTGFQYNSEEQGSILSLDPQPRNITVYPAHVKFSYQQDDANRWELTAHLAPFTDNYSQINIEVATESDRKQDISTWNAILRQTHLIGSSAVLESSFQTFYMSFHNNRVGDAQPVSPGAVFVRYFDTSLGHFFTRGPSPDRFGVSAEVRVKAASKYTKTTAAHTIKLGGEWTEASGRQPRYREVPSFSDLRARPGGGSLSRLDPFAVEGSLRDTLFGVFVQDSWTPRRNVTLDVGVRADWQDRAGFDTTVSPRIGLTVDPSGAGRNKLFANFGIYYSNLFDNIFGFADSRPERDITYRVLNPDANLRGQDVIQSIVRFQLDDDLKNPYTQHFSVGYEHLLPGQLKAGATITKRRGRFQSSSKSRRVSAVEVIQIQATDGRLDYQGLELVLQKAFAKRWEGLISYTLGKTEDDAPGILTPLQQPFSFGPADYDQRHTVTGTGTVVLPADVRFTGLCRYFSGRPFSITNDLPAPLTAFVNRQGQVTGRNQERQPSNWTIDFTLARDFKVNRATLRGLVQVINATNRANVVAVSPSLITPGRPTNVDLSRQVQVGFEVRF